MLNYAVAKLIGTEKAMHISLTPELEAQVRAKVESGLYNNASEVIRDALRFMDTHAEWIYEIKLARLREQIQTGVVQLKQGQGIKIESREELDHLFDTL
jgi:antitoxin ParD1/3/4